MKRFKDTIEEGSQQERLYDQLYDLLLRASKLTKNTTLLKHLKGLGKNTPGYLEDFKTIGKNVDTSIEFLEDLMMQLKQGKMM